MKQDVITLFLFADMALFAIVSWGAVLGVSRLRIELGGVECTALMVALLGIYAAAHLIPFLFALSL